MQALTMSRQLAFSGSFALPGFLIAPAAFPGQLLLAALLDAAVRIVVLRVGNSKLSVLLRCRRRMAFASGWSVSQKTERLASPSCGTTAYWGQAARGIRADQVLRLVVGQPFQRQLHAVRFPWLSAPAARRLAARRLISRAYLMR